MKALLWTAAALGFIALCVVVYKLVIQPKMANKTKTNKPAQSAVFPADMETMPKVVLN